MMYLSFAKYFFLPDMVSETISKFDVALLSVTFAATLEYKVYIINIRFTAPFVVPIKVMKRFWTETILKTITKQHINFGNFPT